MNALLDSNQTTIGGHVYNCFQLNAPLIGHLVQNSSANGTANGEIDLAALVDQCHNVCQLAWGVSKILPPYSLPRRKTGK